MKRIFSLLLFVLPFVVSAQSTTAKSTQAKASTSKKAVKKAPATTKKTAAAAKPAPLKGMPVMSFDNKTFDFGKIKTGDKPIHVFNFTNTGDQPLDIEIVSGCDCTELEYTQKTVNPGEKGFVKATFNTTKAEPEDHKKPLKKDITIVLKQKHPKSGYPLVEELKFDVFIID